MIEITKLKEKIPVYDIEVEDNHNFFANGLCVHNCEIFQPNTPLDGYNTHTQKKNDAHPEVGVCILANVNMGYAKIDDLPKCANYIIRFLDNLLDASEYGAPEIEYAAKKRRALGIGISNLFGFLAKSKLFYNTYEARREVSKFMERWCYELHSASIELAKERGKCELFEDTIYADSKFPFERFKMPEFLPELDWDSLREELIKYGIRNSSLCAIPPSGNAAQVSNSTNGIEPPRELITIKTDKNRTHKKIVPWYKSSKNYYTTAWSQDFDNHEYLKLVSVLQHYVDQAISLNLYSNTINEKRKIEDIIELMVESFNLGIKTWYYENFRSQDDTENAVGCESGGCSV